MEATKRNKLIVAVIFLLAVLGSGYVMFRGYVYNAPLIKKEELRGRTQYDLELIDSLEEANKKKR
ncbi:MAG: hypothetical protein RLZZ370_487 [Bacteroidota bacterium]|jgi:hypothetical protein